MQPQPWRSGIEAIQQRTAEGRRHERVAVTLPVQVDGGGDGFTRDVCADGIYLVMDASPAPGRAIRFTVEFGGPDGPLVLECRGEILRIEEGNGRIGVAATIAASRLQRRGTNQPGNGERT